MPGARHTAQEAVEIQKIHDSTVSMGAMCKTAPSRQALLYADYISLTNKAGAKHSAEDKRLIQALHDDACELGAKCPETKYKALVTNVDLKNTMVATSLIQRGGPTSGNWAHVGRPGKHAAVLAAGPPGG